MTPTTPTPAQIAAEMNRLMTDDKTLTEIRNMAEYNLTQPARAESEKEMNTFDETTGECLASCYDDSIAGHDADCPLAEVESKFAALAARVAELEAALTNIVNNVDMGDFIITVAGTYDEPEHPANLDFARRLLESK